jgi:DNA-3-methyladenine glycosylase I
MKIEAAVRNVQALLAIQQEFGSLDAYCWRFVDGRPKLNRWKATREKFRRPQVNRSLSRELKHRGFGFVWFDRRLCAHAGGW